MLPLSRPLLPAVELALFEIVDKGGRLALGPFRLSKLGTAPFWLPFRSEWAPLEGPVDRNFDARPWRDLNSDPLSWFQSPFFGRSKKNKV